MTPTWGSSGCGRVSTVLKLSGGRKRRQGQFEPDQYNHFNNHTCASTHASLPSFVLCEPDDPNVMSEQPQGASLAGDSSPAQHIHWQSSFDAQPTHLLSSPEAGPSSPRSDIVHGPLELSTSRTSQAENDEVDKAIHAKRRKSSLLPGVTIHLPNPLHRKHGKRKDSIGGDSHHHHEHEHDIHESPEALAAERTEGGGGGLEIPDIADHRETDEGRELEEELDRLLKEAEEARGQEKNHIAILEGGRKKSSDPEEPSESELPDPGREYVWEGRSISSFAMPHYADCTSLIRESKRVSWLALIVVPI
jgi:hypothetical protein